MGRAGAGKNQHSCDSHTLLPAQGWLPAAPGGAGRETEKGLQVWVEHPAERCAGCRMLGDGLCRLNPPYQPALELGPFWHWGGSSSEAAAPARTQPGRERPWPRCLCSTRCLAQTKAVATFVASVNRLLLSLAASRHLLLQPSTEQMPVWSSGGRESPELQYFTFPPTALPSWQRLHLDSHNAQTALPPPHGATRIQPPAPHPSFRSKALGAVGLWCSALAQSAKHRVGTSLCQAGRWSRSGEGGMLQGAGSSPSAPQLLGDP